MVLYDASRIYHVLSLRGDVVARQLKQEESYPNANGADSEGEE